MGGDGEQLPAEVEASVATASRGMIPAAGGRSETRSRRDGFGLIGLGVGARALGLALGTAAGLATVVLAVRLLGPTAYGTLAFALSTALIFAGIGRLGLEPSVARAISVSSVDESDRTGYVARGALHLVALTSLVGVAATFVVIEWGTRGLDQSTRLLLGIGLGLVLYSANVAAVAGSLARGTGRVVLMELPNLVGTLVRLAAVVLLVAIGVADLRWVAVGFGVAAIAALAASWRVTRAVVTPSVLTAGLRPAREVFVSSVPFAVTGLAVIVISRFDVVVLGLSASSTEVGRYEPVLRIVEQAMLLAPLLFAAQYLPVASRAFEAGKHATFRELYVGLSKLVFIVSFPAVILLAAFPETVMRTLYGGGFVASGAIVWLLLPGFVINLAFGLNSSALAAAGDRRALARSGVIGTVTMVVLALSLIPPFGAEGAAAATAGTYVVVNVWVATELVMVAKTHPVRRDFVLTLLTATVPLLGAFAVRVWLEPSGLVSSLGWSLALAGLWIVVLLRFRVVTRHELSRLVPRPG